MALSEKKEVRFGFGANSSYRNLVKGMVEWVNDIIATVGEARL